MERRVPIDTGALAESIRAETNRGNLLSEVGPRGRDVYYGYWVEHGHSSMPAQPFSAPAAEAERRRFPDRIRKHVGKHLPK